MSFRFNFPNPEEDEDEKRSEDVDIGSVSQKGIYLKYLIDVIFNWKH